MSNFSQLFFQITDNFVFFLDEKERLKKFQNFEKKIEMLKVDPKTANLATLQNLDVIEKNGCRIQNQRPKINKV